MRDIPLQRDPSSLKVQFHSHIILPKMQSAGKGVVLIVLGQLFLSLSFCHCQTFFAQCPRNQTKKKSLKNKINPINNNNNKKKPRPPGVILCHLNSPARFLMKMSFSTRKWAGLYGQMERGIGSLVSATAEADALRRL